MTRVSRTESGTRISTGRAAMVGTPVSPPTGFARRCEGPVGIATHFFKKVLSMLDSRRSASEERPRLRHQTILLANLVRDQFC
jgi:hypothetical protein